MTTTKQQLNGMAKTFNLEKGNGTIEALFAFVILGIAVLAMFYDSNEIPRWIVATVSTMSGYYFGVKAMENSKK